MSSITSFLTLVASNMVFHLKDPSAIQLVNREMALIALWLAHPLPPSSVQWPSVGFFTLFAERVKLNEFNYHESRHLKLLSPKIPFYKEAGKSSYTYYILISH